MPTPGSKPALCSSASSPAWVRPCSSWSNRPCRFRHLPCRRCSICVERQVASPAVHHRGADRRRHHIRLSRVDRGVSPCLLPRPHAGGARGLPAGAYGDRRHAAQRAGDPSGDPCSRGRGDCATGTVDRPALLALIAALGYVPAFVLMGKGWTYQALPFLMLGLIAFLLQLRRLTGLGAMSVLRKQAWLGGDGPCSACAGRTALRQGRAPRRTGAGSGGYRSGDRTAEDRHRRDAAAAGASADPHGRRRLSLAPVQSLDRGERFRADSRGAQDDPQKVERLIKLREDFLDQAALDIDRERPDIVFDAGTDGSAGYAAVHANPAIARVLGGYRVLYQDRVVTVLVRSDLVSGDVPAGATAPP